MPDHPDVDKNRLAHEVPIHRVHTLVVGSGAAGLNAAVQLRASGIEDLLILTEGFSKGTSINTGSDKQTYYKLSLCGDSPDSPRELAETLFAGGGMHGDLALVEASVSPRAFLHLVNLGVPFPRDAFGQFVGYKTDHDPRQRATSIGPYTSREMCRALIERVRLLKIPVTEGRHVVRLATIDEGSTRRVCGLIAADDRGELEVYLAENVVFAVGGPGGLYKTAVYPAVHTGAIGVALMAGATAQNLPESQYGMASIKHRWNVSGTYMQVVPRIISTGPDANSDEREFLPDYFESLGEMNSSVFLKGYQWPFDSRKAVGGSSIVDILVYIETVLKGRRVFFDFRSDPAGFRFEELSDEARQYLQKSAALQATPIERLEKMNPGAIQIYLDHGIDIRVEPLEIAVCAQHNNGGLAGNHWWESTNLRHLFPVGEVNGSHGVYRPGGSALNSGQVGAFRAAEFIANRYAKWSLSHEAGLNALQRELAEIVDWLDRSATAARSWQEEREEFQARMSRSAAHIRRRDDLDQAVEDAWQQVRRLEQSGCRFTGAADSVEALRTFQLGFAHAVYLEAVLFAVTSGTGSRGSAMVVDPAGEPVHPGLDDTWRIAGENTDFRSKVQQTLVHGLGSVENRWVDRRPLPESDTWFETAWSRFRSGEIYE
ncbi:MAG: FAD-binding protein [Planctomycetaceae bacterium]|nr:FAD-binding protein [Planctomycetaceae bacterium]